MLRSLFQRWKNPPESAEERAGRSAARTGAKGEEAAAAMLRNMGWRILARNWRSGHLELDIVAEDHGELVFVEVKTRAKDGMTQPYEALSAVKKERLLRAAKAWIAEHDAWEKPCRFDLVCVLAAKEHYRTELMSNVIEHAEHGTRHPVGGGHSSWQPW